MLTLGAEYLDFRNVDTDGSFLVRLSRNCDLPKPLRHDRAFLSHSPHTCKIPDGFCLYIFVGESGCAPPLVVGSNPSILLPPSFDYLGEGDVLRISPQRRGVRALYRNSVRYNAILLTERCNSYCLMCSQPPKKTNDSWIIDETLRLLRLIDPRASELCFSGGEPTLLGQDLFTILKAAESWLPNTSVHLLSNGRRFADLDFAVEYASINHHDLMVGIPLYSDLSTQHDFVVQADGAYDETIRGILNLKQAKARVEIRVVIHKQTYERLPQLAEFIARNLLFVDHVALMGLELTGFTKPNLHQLWIDPYDYGRELEAAVMHLARHRMNVSIYNHQLCVLKPTLWQFAKQSISDWKNEYLPECQSCVMRPRCGGFFTSGLSKPSEHIHSFATEPLYSNLDETCSV
jgi:His-Xaa-Ser system radical SAM maturase HxsC